MEEKKAQLELKKWGLIKKVYGTLAAQFLLTTIAYVMAGEFINIIKENPLFFNAFVKPAVLSLVFLIVDSKTHLLNLTFLGVLSVCVCVPIGVMCGIIKGDIVLSSLILTSAVWSSLTGYTFLASKMSYLALFLPASLIFCVIVGFMKMFYSVGTLVAALHNGIGTILFSVLITHDIDMLLTNFAHDDYIKASFRIFISIVLIFLNVWMKLLFVYYGCTSTGPPISLKF